MPVPRSMAGYWSCATDPAAAVRDRDSWLLADTQIGGHDCGEQMIADGYAVIYDDRHS